VTWDKGRGKRKLDEMESFLEDTKEVSSEEFSKP